MGRFLVLTVMAFACVALGGCANQPSPERRDAAAMTEATRDWAPGQCEDWVIVERAFSGSDDTDLVGFADNVFVGRVEERAGATVVKPDGPMDPGRPFGTTRFSVEVLENVKGKLGGAVTVAQEGAYDPERGCAMLADDDPLLDPEQEVMFFTRRDERRGWHQIVTPGYGNVRIEGEGQREELVRRFERARKNQTNPLR